VQKLVHKFSHSASQILGGVFMLITFRLPSIGGMTIEAASMAYWGQFHLTIAPLPSFWF
jgi:hypothetical protein